MTQAIIQDLKRRYTTKSFDKTKRISPEKLVVLYEAMRLTPSSINSQPWKFIVLTTDSAKKRMAKTFVNKFQFNQPHIINASHIILFAHNSTYRREDYEKVIDKGIEDGRTAPDKKESAFAAYAFAELNTDKNGNNGPWTKAQTYIALGNALHTLARLKIDSTPMEGIDIELVEAEFAKELAGYSCDVALAIGYHLEGEDYNAKLPKSRLELEDILQEI